MVRVRDLVSYDVIAPEWRSFWDLFRPSWPAALAALTINLVTALIEGASIGLLALALYVIGGEAPGQTAGPRLGAVGPWLEHMVAAMGRDGAFLSLVLMAIGAQGLRSGCQFLGEALSAHVQVRAHADAYQRIFAGLMRLEFARISAYRLGTLTDYLEQTGHLGDLVDKVYTVVRSAFLVVVYGALLFWLSWPMTLAVLAAYGLISALLRRTVATVRRHAARSTSAAVELSERATEFLQAVRVIHLFARQGEAARDVTHLTRREMAGRWRATLWTKSVEPITEMLAMVGIGAFLIGGYLVLVPRGLTTLPLLIAFLLALYRVAPRFQSLYSHWAGLVAMAPSVRRVAEILRETEEHPIRIGGRPFPGLRRAIEFRRVTLRYRPEEPPAVSELSFTIPRGRCVALVGSSGAGKSTIADLLLGLYAPTSGSVLADEIDIATLEPASWRARLGVVSQEPFLFHASIRENIAFGNPQADMDAIIAAARAAHAEEFISRLAEGYDTVIGDRGFRLSGGQRQRIALARALVREPDILVLDEATSALDSESEQHIQLALEEQRGARTVLVIAHRLSTVVRADRIMVVAEGALVEQGTHDELLAHGGIYARLWYLQAKHTRPPSASAVAVLP